MYKAVIFDLDGTLLYTLEDLAIACNYALEKNGLKIHDVQDYRQFVGDGRYKLIERIIPKGNNDKELFDRVLKDYDVYYMDHMMDKTIPYDGIIELINEIKNKKIKMAVVSNKPQEFTVDMVGKYFGNSMDLIFGHREGYKTKPAPDSVNEAISIFNLDKSQVLYIGDSNVDIMTAKNAELKSVGVAWGFRGEEELKNAGADIIVQKPSEILEIL